jgi:hypothetical protein
MSAPRRKPARWRKSKGHDWGKWELWRAATPLAYIQEVRLRSGDRRYVWRLVARDPSGQTDTLDEAKKAARTAMEHAEIEAAIADVVDRWPDEEAPLDA